MNRTFAAIAASTALFATTAHAQDEPEAPSAEPPAAAADAPDSEPPATGSKSEVPANSINLSPLGIVIGSYSLNYERLLSGGHGLLVEGLYSSSSDADTSSTGYGGALGYRYHFNGTQDSWFAGANLGYQIGTGEAKIETTSNGMTTKTSFDVDVTAFTATANFGRRWAWDFGLNITARIGAGYASYGVSTDSNDPDAQDAVELVNDLLTIIPVALDGELSVGWVF